MVNLKEKNLLIICDGYPSKDNKIYSNIFVKNQLKYIAPYFDKVYVISPTPYFPKIFKHLKFLPKRYTNASKLENYSEKNTSVFFPKFLTLPFSKYYQNHKNALFLKSAIKTIKNNSLTFDIIHAHFTKPCGVVANKISKQYAVPYILTVHEGPIWLEKEISQKNTDFINAWSNAKKIIRVNKKDIKKLRKYNKNTVHIPNGFDSTVFKYTKNQNIKEKTVVFIGNLVIREKNQINLINAFNILIKKYPKIKLHIIGEGQDKEKIVSEISRLKLNDYIKLLGSKKPEEIKAILDRSNLLVLPSFEESFGIVQIEAMACGVPVVATVNGGSEEIITSRDVGILVKDPKNIKELADTIDKALNRKWDKKKIERFSSKYSWERISNKILAIYKLD